MEHRRHDLGTPNTETNLSIPSFAFVNVKCCQVILVDSDVLMLPKSVLISAGYR